MSDIRRYTRVNGGSQYSYLDHIVFVRHDGYEWLAYVDDERIRDDRGQKFRTRESAASAAELFALYVLPRRKKDAGE